MPFASGTVLGHYEISEAIGAGGMGEVYKARDIRLNREVAVKVLPDLFSRDPDRLARFEREAQAVAALSHPNVLAIYDFGTVGTSTYAVMELLDGETLRERVARGPQPPRRAMEIGAQIARGLAAAHARGIVHRDLKPENIFLTRDGRAKILDFGLARHSQPETMGAGLTMPATDPGLVLGTVGYMAPEQVRGLPADARSDVFALGAVLYELVSGQRAFHRESAAETMTAIAREDPLPLAASTAGSLPPSLERIIWRCLEKDPAARFQSCHDLAFALEGSTVESGSASQAGVSSIATRRWSYTSAVPWAAAGALLGAMVTGVFMTADTSPQQAVARFEIGLPAGASLQLAGQPAVALAPDGSAVAFAAVSDGIARLYLRRRTDREARALSGTEGATAPAFSPNGRWIAFSSGLDLKKVSLEGAVTTLATGIVTDDSRGATWVDDNQIVFAPDPVRGLFRVSAEGGQVSVLSEPDAARDERTHRWPAGIVGHDAVLLTVGASSNPDHYDTARIDALRLATRERVPVIEGASMARYHPDGRLVFARGGALYSVAFDARTLKTSGAPTVVEQGIATDVTSGAAHFSFAHDGTLVYVHTPTSDNQRTLSWVDRSGVVSAIDLPPAVYSDPSLSPDGSKFAVVVGPSGGGDVYIHDVERRTFQRLTFDGRNATPIWSADGRNVYYASVEPRRRAHIMRKPADGSREAERLHTIDSRIYLGYLSDATTLVGYVPDLAGPPPRRSDIVQVRLGQPGSPAMLVATEGQDYNPAVSPDGRYLAYTSDAAGRPEIFVRDLSGSGAQWQVSFTGGEEPKWSPDGSELYYRNGSMLMVTAVDVSPTFRVAPTRPLIHGIYNLRVESGMSYAVHSKTGRFLMIRLAGDPRSAPTLRVVLNWLQSLDSSGPPVRQP